MHIFCTFVNMIRYIITNIIFLFLFLPTTFSQVYFFENFESFNLVDYWDQDYVFGTINWKTQNGGGSMNPNVPGSGHPPYAQEGVRNAIFHYASLNNETTKLITPPLNLEFAIKPQLHFMHSQEERFSLGEYNNDELRVYCRKSKTAPWILLQEYTKVVTGWQWHSINLPDTILTKNYYIAFEGKTKNGWGVCIDSMKVIETGIQTRRLDNLTIKQASDLYIPTGTKNNSILRIDLRVTGNDQHVYLHSLKIKSLNSSDNDVLPNGVKLFATRDTFFSSQTQIGDALSLSDGYAHFSSLNYSLPTGYTTLWVTYDISSTAHHGNIADALIEANSIVINGNSYPSMNESPGGNRLIVETVFHDDFETDKGWLLTGEFQRAVPMGLGGNPGNPDPMEAVSDSMIIGTDITGLGQHKGNYEDTIAPRAYQAISPTFDCFYYKDVNLRFYRHLNIDISDSAYIDVSPDNGITWHTVWFNTGTVTEESWNLRFYDISRFAERKKNVKIRFALGPTDPSWNFSGWNIDDVFITADYIESDLGIARIVSPQSGIGHTSSEQVKVYVKNYGASPTEGNIPLVFHIQDTGGITTTLYDTLKSSIAVGDSVLFVFSQTIDLSKKTIYKNTYVATILPSDEFKKNDTVQFDLFVIPTYSVPYAEDFESVRNFWLINGIWEKEHALSSWQYGTPNAYTINKAASGTKAWVTNLNGAYKKNDSSYVISPYVNFSGVEYPLFEMKLWVASDNGIDGAVIEYTLDTGRTWHIINKHTYPYTWNWYDTNYVSSLKSNGWTGVSDTWITVRQFLPLVIKNKTVAFRIRFGSDNYYSGAEGIAFDDVYISDALPDVGITDMVSPSNACELSHAESITVSMKNYGIKTLYAGEKIPLGIIVDNDSVVLDTFSINSNIAPNTSALFTFTKQFDLYKAGNHHITAFTSHPYDRNIYSDSLYNNDTIHDIVSVQKPSFRFGNDIYTVRPDTVLLTAYTVPGETYLWNDGSTLSYFQVNTEGTYSVTITNTIPCSVADTINIIELIANVCVAEITTPVSSCFLSNNEPISIRIRNNGSDTIRSNYLLDVYYSINFTTPTKETFTIPDTILPGDSYIYTFDTKADFSTFKTYYITAYCSYPYDKIKTDDTATKITEVYGPATFDLFPDDTAHPGTQFVLDAQYNNSDLVSYRWEDGSTIPLFIVYYPGGQYYSVTVTDIHGCTNSDSALVNLEVPDIGVTRLISPTSSCGEQGTLPVTITISNIGADIISAGNTIWVGYKLNALSSVSENILLAQNFMPGDSLHHTFNEQVTLQELDSYNFTAYAKYSGDSVQYNDTLKLTVMVHPVPMVQLGPDSLILHNVPYHILDGGDFASYSWSTGSTDRYLVVTGDNSYPYHRFYITVTDINGCKASDQIYMKLIYSDIQLKEITPADTVCGILRKPLTFTITNKGTVILTTNSITAGYSIDGAPDVVETFSIKKDIYKDSSIIYTFKKKENITAAGLHRITGFVTMANDVVQNNDTLEKEISYLGIKPPLGDTDTMRVASFPYPLILSGYTTYLWHNNTTNPGITIYNPQWIAVTVTDLNDCLISDSVYVAKQTGIKEIFDNYHIAVYPNPVSRILTIHLLAQNPEVFILRLTNIAGQEVIIQKSKPTNELLERWYIDYLPSGIYYLSINNGKQEYNLKIIKQ